MARKRGEKAENSSVEKTKQSGKEEEKMSDEAGKDTDIDPSRILKESEKEKPWKMLAAVSFVVVMLFIGVPLWWKTTEVYRAPVPFDEIQNLADRTISIPFRVELVWSDSSLKSLVEETEAKLIQFFDSEDLIHPEIRILTEINSGPLSETQKQMLNAPINQEITSDSEKSNDLPLTFIILSKDSTSLNQGTDVFFGPETTVYARADQNLEENLRKAIVELYLNEERIAEIVKRNLKEKTPDIDSKKSMWTGSLYPKQSLDYYLINPDPESCPTRGIDLDSTVDRGLRPFYAQLNDITDLHINSQILYYIDLPRKPVYDEKRKVYVMEFRHLPHLITPMEKYVTSLEPAHPVFNILLYITPPAYYPLIVLDENNEPSKYNSFSIAGWGGMTVVNLPEKCNASAAALKQLPTTVQSAIISQLRAIFGISQPLFPKSFDKSRSPLSRWELQRQTIHATVENLMVSVTTLRSLTKLLDEIRNIVIKDEVSESIQRAVDELELSFKALNSRDFHRSLAHSRVALIEAERAFFDPSLLELLYFPDDQKYAIYIPLFLPVGAPVVLSLRHLFRYAKEKFGKTKTD